METRSWRRRHQPAGAERPRARRAARQRAGLDLNRDYVKMEAPETRGAAELLLEAFTVDRVVRDPLFEGHRPVRLEGRWSDGKEAAAAGWYLVRTAQPRGVLAAYLLEPASKDGVATWNLLDAGLSVGRPYPILRLRRAVSAAGVVAP